MTDLSRSTTVTTAVGPPRRRSPLARVLALLVALAMVAAACGSSDDDDEGEDGSTEETSETTEDEDEGGETTEDTEQTETAGEIELPEDVEEIELPPEGPFEPAGDPEAATGGGTLTCEEYLAEGYDASVANKRYVAAACASYDGGQIEVLECRDPALTPAVRRAERSIVIGDPGELEAIVGESEAADAVLELNVLVDNEPGEPTAGFGYILLELSPERSGALFENDDRVVVSPVHVYESHKMTRGHPIDEFTSGPGSPLLSQGGGDPRPVVVIDVGGTPGDGGAAGHGAFIVGLVEPAGIAAEFNPLTQKPSFFFDDIGVVPALLGAAYAAPGEPRAEDFVFNLSFGAPNCEVAPAALTRVIEQLPGDSHIVASAGNGEMAELVFPAALAIDWAGAGPDLFADDGQPVDTGLLADRVTSTGSIAGNGTRSCFSNYGPWVETWYPGEEVWATDGTNWEGTWSGTSFAAPQAAAEIANGQSPNTTTPADLTMGYRYDGLTPPAESYCPPNPDPDLYYGPR